MKNSITTNRLLTLILLLLIVLLSSNSIAIAKEGSALEINKAPSSQDGQKMFISQPDVSVYPGRDRTEREAPNWYSVSGIGFHPYSNTTAFTYINHGCIGSSVANEFRSTFHLPDGAVIAEVYFNYYNMPTTIQTELRLFRSSYEGVSDLIAHLYSEPGSSSGEGYHSAWEDEVTTYNVVDNYIYTYNITWSGSTTQRLCGVNIGYVAPSVFGVALPYIEN